MTCGKRANLLWGVAYLLAVLYIVQMMANLRRETIESMSTPQARADWERYRHSDHSGTSKNGPVQRESPPSAEPPALIMMRDHYGVTLGGSLVFGTALFAALVLAIKGTLWKAPVGEGGGR